MVEMDSGGIQQKSSTVSCSCRGLCCSEGATWGSYFTFVEFVFCKESNKNMNYFHQ